MLWSVEVYGRWCCGTDLLFASVIATFFCFRLVFGLFCVVRVVSVYIGFLVGFGCFWLGALMGGRYRETSSCAILHIVLPTGSLLLLSTFSLVCLKFRIRCSFSVCVISWPHERVDPEECVMFFQQIFGPRDQHPRYVSIFECGRGSLQAWTEVGSVVVMIFLCLAVDVVCYAAFRLCIQF